MHWTHFLQRLQLDNEATVDDQISPETHLELDPLKHNGNRFFALHLIAQVLELLLKNYQVNALQESWSDRHMDLDC